MFRAVGICERYHESDGQGVCEDFRTTTTEGSLVQVAFYGGYFAMAFPAAVFIRKYSYKAGILLGLALYAVGALLFFRPG